MVVMMCAEEVAIATCAIASVAKFFVMCSSVSCSTEWNSSVSKWSYYWSV